MHRIAAVVMRLDPSRGGSSLQADPSSSYASVNVAVVMPLPLSPSHLGLLTRWTSCSALPHDFTAPNQQFHHNPSSMLNVHRPASELKSSGAKLTLLASSLQALPLRCAFWQGFALLLLSFSLYF